MNCPFCSGEIKNYALTAFPILSSQGIEYTRFAYSAAFLECPSCGMMFFLKPGSEHLKNMNLITDEEMKDTFPTEKDISKMTKQEKRDLYEKFKKELIEKYT